MATIHTLIDYDRQNPTAISREQYTDVGADAFSPGAFPRAFNDLEVWDAASGGNQLVLDTDYEYAEVDYELSAANFESEAVYKKLRVINATYQVGSIWLTYSAIGTYPTADLHDASGLPAASALDGTEPIATVQSSEIVKATPAQIAAFTAGDPTSQGTIAAAVAVDSAMTDAFQALSSGIANTVQITGEYMFTADNEVDYSASFTSGMSPATVTFSELPADTVAILVQLLLSHSSTTVLFNWNREEGDTQALQIRAKFADSGTNDIKGLWWMPTHNNSIYIDNILADNDLFFHIIGYKTGE